MATTDFVVKNGLAVTENAVVNGTTDASSKDTGALIVEGGAGIEKKLYVGTDLIVGGDQILTGDVALNGGNLTTNKSTFNLLNGTATNVNFAGSATNLQIGSASGTTNINNNLDVDGDVNIDGGDLTVSTGTFNLANTTATTVNFAGAATALTMGATSGITDIRNNLNVGGNVNIDDGDLTVSTGTFNLANTTATTVNFAGAASTLTIGATSGTTNVRNNLNVTGDLDIDGGDLTVSDSTFNLANTTATTLNIGGAATDIQLGSSSGTTNINNNLDVDLDVNIDGGDLTTNSGTFNLINANATTVNFAGAGTTVNIGATTGAGTTIIKNSVEVDGNIELGNSSSNNVTINSNTINVPNTILITEDDVTADGVSYPVSFRHTTSGTPVNGIGTGVRFITETDSNNFEVGATIEAVVTDISSGSEDFDLIFKLMADGSAPVEKFRIGSNGTVTIDAGLILGTGDFDTTQTTFNLVNDTATTVNFAGSATVLTMGATSGTTRIRNNLDVDGDINIDGGDLTVSDSTFNLVNTTATTLNIGGAATNIQLGSSSGTTNINNNLDVDGDINIDGGDLTVSDTTFNLVNTTATTLNIGGAATSLNLGATTGTTSVKNSLSVAGTLSVTGNVTFDEDLLPAADNTGAVGNSSRTWNNGQFTSLTIDSTLNVRDAIDLADSDLIRFGSSDDIKMFYNGSDNIFDIELEAAATQIDITDNGTTRITFSKSGNIVTVGDVAVNGGDLTTTATTFNLVNTNATAVNFAGAATALTLGATTGTTIVRNNLDVDGDVNIDGGDLTVSTGTFNLANTTATTLNIGGAATNIQLGSSSGTTNINNNLDVDGDVNIDGGDLTVSTGTFNLANTTATTVNFAGAASTLEIGSTSGTTSVNNSLSVDGNTTLGNASSDSVTINATTVNVPNTISIIENDATNAGISHPINISHTTSGTPAVGIGTGVNFVTETANNNFEIGGVIETVTTDVTAASEDFDLVIKTMAAGAAANERIRFKSTGEAIIPSGGSLNVPTISNVSTINFVAQSSDTASISTTINGTGTYFDFNLTDDNNNDWWRWRFTPGGSTVYDAMLLQPVANGAANLIVSGDVAVNGGDLITNKTTFNLINTTATTVNFGGAANTLNIGKAGGTTVIAGNLTVNGTTTTINTTELTVDDKNIELGSVASPTDSTADGGGITLKGSTDKTFNWIDATDSWTSSEHVDLANGKVYKIDQSTVLTETSLGSGVTGSSLTSVGTIGTGVWQGSVISSTYGGTGVNNGGKTITLGGNFTHSGAHSLSLNTTGNTSITLPTSGTLATTGNLSQFAATTSAQLAGVITDETGSGKLVFATSPTFTTGVLTNSSSFNVFNTTATTISAFGAATTLNIGNSGAAQTVNIGTGSTGASTYNFGTGSTATSTIKTLNIGTGGAAGSTTNINIGSNIAGTTTINSGTLVGALASQNLFNTTATTLNIGGAATTFNAGATTGTMTLRNPTIAGSQTTQNLFNTVATTVNFAGAATALTVGATSGTTNIRNNLNVTGDLDIDGGDLTVGDSTFNLVNTTASTLNFGGAATSLIMGATSGTTRIRNNLDVDRDINIDGGDLTVSTGTFNLANTTATTVNFAGAGTSVTIGSTSGTTNIRNANVVLNGDLAVNGADITTTATGASSIFNANTTTLNLAQAATTITMGATSGTTTVRNNLSVLGNSTLGNASSDSVTINASIVNVPNTITTTVNDGVTNNISYPVKLRHTTSGTPAVGIGTGLQFITETANNNFEVGALIEAVATDVNTGTEDFDLIFKTMAAGTSATSKVWIKSTGEVGIGVSPTTLNSVKLDVAGSIHFNNNALIAGATAENSNVDHVWHDDDSAGGAPGTWHFVSDGTYKMAGNSRIQFGHVYASANQDNYFAGNIGAGTPTPGAKLDVRGSAIFNEDSADVDFRVESNNSTHMLFVDGGTDRVGIGVPVPSARLDVTAATPATDTALKVKSNTQFVSPNDVNTIDMRMTDADTLSFSGDSGQLFSITDSLTGTIFAVNDISGVPSIEVIDDGTIILAELVGNVLIGTTTDDGTSRLQVAGNVSVTGSTTISGDIAVNGGDLTTTATTFNLINTTASTVNFAGAATALTMGATSGTTTIRNIVALSEDATDVINFTASTTNDNRGISFNGRTAVSADSSDGILRLNNSSEFTNGVYIPNFLGVGSGANTSYKMTVGSSTDAKIVLSNSTNPLIRWQEGTTDRYYIQWNAGLDAPVYYNQQSRDHYLDTANSGSIALHLRTSGTDRGWLYADSSNNVGFLDAGGSWAIKHTNDNGTYFYTDSATEEFRVGRDVVTGNYGTVQTSSTRGGYGGYSIGGRVVFMHDNSNTWGMYNDVNNEWMIRGELNGLVELRHDNAVKLSTTSTGVDITGLLTATTKSFKIDHPTKPGMSLQYACLEGPENGVYVRGKLKDSNIIELPDYWLGLVDPESITVSITPKGRKQEIFVEDIVDNCVYLDGENIDCFYVVYGERKDVAKLEVEVK